MNIKMTELSPSDNRIELASLGRDQQVTERAKSMVSDLVKSNAILTKKDLAKWRQAWQMALSMDNPKRNYLYDIYDDNMVDLHLTGAINNRKLKVLGRPFKLVDKKTSKEDPDMTMLFKKRWFKKFLSLALDSIYWGHSLIQLGDIISDEDGMAFSEVKLVPRRHVSPEFGMLLKNASDEAKKGIDYRKTFADWAIEVCEDSEDLGLLNKLSQQCIPKRNMLAFWDQFGEIFGMPIRVGTTMSRDQKDIDKMGNVLDKMGSAGWGMFPVGTDIKIVESSRGDAWMVYDKRIDRANSEMSKGVGGQTMTMDNGSSKSQAQVHENVSDDIAAADADFLADLVNDKLKPVMNRHGFKLEKYRFEWDDSYELSPTEMLEVEKMILEHYDVDPKYFIEKHNIPITGKKNTGTTPPDKTPLGEKKKPDQVKLVSEILAVHYTTCPDCGGAAITLAADDKLLEKEANRIARAIFDGKMKAGDIDPAVVKRVYELLRKGMIEGYGVDLPDVDSKTPDYKMLQNLQDNVYQFSVAKNYSELREMTDLLIDGDKVRTFSEFKQAAMDLHNLFHKGYLETEYNTAINSGEMASRWVQFQDNKETMPMGTYKTVGDSRVRPAHKLLDGITLQLDDPDWDVIWPPNDWACRCTVNQTGSGDVTPKSQRKYPEIPAMFRTNLAKNGLVFPADHPYFNGLPDNLKKMKP